MLHMSRTIFISLIAALVCAHGPVTGSRQSEHPPLGKYAVYSFDPYGNAEFAFEFELLTAPSQGKPGRYELQMGRVAESERERWRGDYEYDVAAQRVRWLSGPFERSELYKQGAQNPDGGKVVVKNNNWTIFLNRKSRGTHSNR